MPDNDILQGFQLGFQSSLQRQRLKSEAAMLRLREQQIAQAMALKMQENDLAIQFRADMAKAVQAAQDASSPTVTVPMLGQEGIGDMAPPVMTVDNPNPMSQADAAMQFILPVIGKYAPDKVPQVLQNIALSEARAAAGESLIKQRESSIAVNEARIKQIDARTKEITEGKGGTDPEWVKSITFLEERLGGKLPPETIKEMFEVKSGLKPKLGTARVPTEGEYVSRHIDKAMDQPLIEEVVTAKKFGRAPTTETIYRTPRNRAEAQEALKIEYANLFQKQAAPDLQAAPEAAVRVRVQSPDGKFFTVPASQLEQAIKQGYRKAE